MLITKRIHVEDKTCKVTFVSKYHRIVKDFVNPPPDAVRTSSGIGFRYLRFVGAFVKLRKSNISFVVSVRLFVCLSLRLE